MKRASGFSTPGDVAPLRPVMPPRELTPCAERLLVYFRRRFAEKVAAGDNSPCWYASCEGYAEELRGRNYSRWQISRAKAELERGGWITLKQRRDENGEWTSTLVQPARRLWAFIRDLADGLRHRVRFSAHKSHTSCDIEGKKLKKAPPGDSSSASKVTAEVWNRLTLASLRAPPPKPTD